MKENNRVVFYLRIAICLVWHIFSGVIIAKLFGDFLLFGSYSPQTGMVFWNVMSMLPSGLTKGILIANAPVLIIFSILLHNILMRLDRKDYEGTFGLQALGALALVVFYLLICQGFAFYLFIPLAFECLILSLIDATINQRTNQARSTS